MDTVYHALPAATFAECYMERKKTIDRWAMAGLSLADPNALVLEAASLPGAMSEAALRLLDPHRRDQVALRIQRQMQHPQPSA